MIRHIASIASRPSLLLVLAAAITAGCGSADEGFQIGGTVNFEGQPVPYGFINVVPNAQAGNSGRQAMADIRDGEISTGTHLIAGGPSRLRISCFDGVPYKSDLQMITTGKPLAPPQSAEIDLPRANAELVVDIRKVAANRYQVDVTVQ